MKAEKNDALKKLASDTRKSDVSTTVASAQVTSVASSYGLPGQTILYTYIPEKKQSS